MAADNQSTEPVVAHPTYRALRKIRQDEKVDSHRQQQLLDEGLIEETDEGFQVDYAELERMWFDLWGEEIDEKPRLPEHFSEFFEGYVRSYLIGEKNSNIFRMLKPDFLHGLNLADRQGEISPSLQELKQQLEEGYSRHHFAPDHVIEGVRQAKH